MNMWDKIRSLIGKYWNPLVYLFFGALTTLVNFAVYFLLYNLLSVSATLSNVIAWAVAVVVAYLTNKPFVFHSHDWTLRVVFPEFAKFLGCRIGSGALETGIIWLTVDILAFDGNWIKIIVSVLVVILNYIASKLIVFRKNK